MKIIFLGLLAFLSTFLGGLFAVRFRDKLHLILGFSAGAVLSVAFFDLMPEALELGSSFYATSSIISFTAVGFILFMILDRLFFFHSHQCLDLESHSHHRGKLGAGSLILHSFLDGMIIGLAFQVSNAFGAIITAAVLVHDFSDGINTISLILRGKDKKKEALYWLLLDALAPFLGVISSFFFILPEKIFSIILAIFSGFFLYIGASDLLPESHHNHPTLWTTVATIIGISVIYIVIQLIGV